MTEQVVEEKKEKQRAPWDETIRTVLIALFLAIMFRSLAYEPFHIPSGSMKNTLLVGDYLFVSKYSYGYSRYSFPLGIMPIENRIGTDNRPKRGDIVVFRLPSNTRIDYIKRVIGLPGDTVQLKGGIVYLNDKPLPREKVENFTDSENSKQLASLPKYVETLPSGKSFNILKYRHFGMADDTDKYVVPEKHYFMMGDNRDNSTDSRFSQVGFIPEKNIIGKAQMIFFSINGEAEMFNPLSWFSSMRYNRFFQSLN